MDISILEDLGLSPAEIKVYLSLVEHGVTKAGPLVRATRLHNSAVHIALGKLVEKGLATFMREGRIKHYAPSDPRAVLRYIDEKRRKAESLTEALLAKQSFQRQEAAVFRGFQGFKAMCYELIADAQPGDDYLFFAFVTAKQKFDEEVNVFYRDFSEDRLRRGLKIKGIAHVAAKPYFVKNKRDLTNVVFVDFPVLRNTSVCGDKVIFTPWEDTEISFMITSASLAGNLREHFFSIWNGYRRGGELVQRSGRRNA